MGEAKICFADRNSQKLWCDGTTVAADRRAKDPIAGVQVSAEGRRYTFTNALVTCPDHCGRVARGTPQRTY